MINDISVVKIEQELGGQTVFSAVSGLPPGGQDGQILAKASNSNYDLEWTDQAVGVPAGGLDGQILVKNSNADYDISWENLVSNQSTETVVQTAYNDSGSNIEKGSVVYIVGGDGSFPKVSKASAATEHDAEVLGIAAESILSGTYGLVMIRGILDGINTNDFSLGDKLYLSPVTNGVITNIQPQSPDHEILVGYCVNNSASGSIYVKIDNGNHLNKLHDVLIGSPAVGQTLLYSESGIWTNKNIEIQHVSGLSGAFYSSDNPSGFITGVENVVYTTGDQIISGIKTFHAQILAPSGLEVGQGSVTLFVESGFVGINNESPAGALDVSGSVLFSERPQVNGTGVLLSGDLSGYYTNDNPSGFITGINSIRGQISKMTSSTFNISQVGAYTAVGVSGFFDSNTALGTSISETGFFGIKNISNNSFIVEVYASMDASAGSNETLGIKIAKNNIEIDESECRANTSNSNFAKLATNWMLEANPGDEFSLFAANHSSTNSIEFQRGRIVLSSVL